MKKRWKFGYHRGGAPPCAAFDARDVISPHIGHIDELWIIEAGARFGIFAQNSIHHVLTAREAALFTLCYLRHPPR